MKLTDYETSKALKELGFNGECRYGYTYLDNKLDNLRGALITNTMIDYDNERYGLYEHDCACPYLPQAADFLREQYGVHVETNPLPTNDRVDFNSWMYDVYKNGEDFNIPGRAEHDYPDHDTALQEGVKKGVEVVKE